MQSFVTKKSSFPKDRISSTTPVLLLNIGVFICTLFGLLIAMVVLVIEVLNMKKAEKNKVKEITTAWKGIQ